MVHSDLLMQFFSAHDDTLSCRFAVFQCGKRNDQLPFHIATAKHMIDTLPWILSIFATVESVLRYWISCVSTAATSLELTVLLYMLSYSMLLFSCICYCEQFCVIGSAVPVLLRQAWSIMGGCHLQRYRKTFWQNQAQSAMHKRYYCRCEHTEHFLSCASDGSHGGSLNGVMLI